MPMTCVRGRGRGRVKVDHRCGVEGGYLAHDLR